MMVRFVDWLSDKIALSYISSWEYRRKPKLISNSNPARGVLKITFDTLWSGFESENTHNIFWSIEIGSKKI